MKSANLNKAKVTFLILLTFFFSDCSNKKEVKQWDLVKINPEIPKDSIYKELDGKEEIFSVFEEQDSRMRKTSAVAYFTRKEKVLRELAINNCRAYFHPPDVLVINIGISNGFAGQGFVINYKNTRFYTEPYYFTDADIEGFESTYENIYQKLTLNKSNYKVGDSLYGRVEFKSLETNAYNEKIEHSGIGNFRTKVSSVE